MQNYYPKKEDDSLLLFARFDSLFVPSWRHLNDFWQGISIFKTDTLAVRNVTESVVEGLRKSAVTATAIDVINWNPFLRQVMRDSQRVYHPESRLGSFHVHLKSIRAAFCLQCGSKLHGVAIPSQPGRSRKPAGNRFWCIRAPTLKIQK